MFRSRAFFLVLITALVMIAGFGFTTVPVNTTVEEVQCTHCPKPPRPPVDVHYSHHKSRPVLTITTVTVSTAHTPPAITV